MLYLTKNNLLSVHQHGFRKGHSIGSQLLGCLNYYTSALVEDDCIDACYIDFKRAFDNVSIPKLIHKLSSFGISGECRCWLCDFLMNRKMWTRINNAFSECFEQTSGIVQETVLETMCFMLYISDLPDLIKNCEIKLYADDVKLYFCFSPKKWCDVL